MEAFKILKDKKTNELLFGGGAGGAKSHLGCAWLILNCLEYQGSRWLMGRAVLKSLKESTLLTFFDICKSWGLIKGEDYTYNQIEGIINFTKTNSTIYLKDLFAYPSDPEFDSLGSTEFTGVFIDEGAQITLKAFNICKSRIRYKLDEFGIIPKILICSNPCKNFLYSDFYKPWKSGELLTYRKFLPALAKDNPFVSKFYIENLKKLDIISKERLLYGNWEYDDDPNRLFEYDKIVDMFTNNVKRGTKYCIVDQSGRGRDKAVITLWDGLFVYKIYIYSVGISSMDLDKILQTEGINRSNCLADEDGVGFGLVKDLPGIKGFVNNATAIKGLKKALDQTRVDINYANLKAQCWDTLANYVNVGQIGVYRDIKIEQKKLIIEDLEHIKQTNVGKDQPFRVSTKENLKEEMGRSTDIGDTFMMRMFFELKPSYVPYISI